MLDWNKISVAQPALLGYYLGMNRYGTIADLTRWAEETLPGEESRGRSVIVGCRKAGLITKGGHGRNAPYMQDADFATAVLAVLHPGQVTQVHEAVPAYAKLPLALVRVEDPSEGAFDTLPENIQGNDALRPYFARFHYPLSGLGNLESVLILLFHLHAAHEDFSVHDFIELHTMADKIAVRIVLNGGTRFEASGWPGSGPEHSQVTFYFGEFNLFGGRFLKTTRTIYADALNALSLMTPGLTKPKPEVANG